MTVWIGMLAALLVPGGEHCLAQVVRSGDVETRIDSVAVAGSDEIPRAEMENLLLSKPGVILNDGLVARDRETLIVYLRENGWWNAAVEAAVDSVGGRIVLTFRATPGKRVRFGRLRLRAGDIFPGGESAALPDLSGKPFSRGELDGVIGGILSALTEDGYPGATVAPFLSARGDTVDVALGLAYGVRAHVDSIAVRGLGTTKDYVIRRELAWLRGRPVSPDIAELARTAVGRLRFLRLETAPVIEYEEDGRAVLVVNLAEGNRSSFDGVLGYQPAGDGGSGELVGRVDLGLDNLFGTGRSSRVRWENLGGDSQDMEFRYEEPWVFGLPFNVEGTFMQERRPDRGYTRTLLTAGAARAIGRLNAHAGFRNEVVSADSLQSASAVGIEAGASWTALDNPSNPRSGFRYAAEWSSVSKRRRFEPGGRSYLSRKIVGWEQYLPVSRSQTLALNLNYRRIDAGARALDPADRFWLGGSSTIRGYRERVFPANKALLATAEYRFLTGPFSRAFLFADIGHLWNRERQGTRYAERSSTHLGYGFGLRLRSRAGTLGFDYGLGKGDAPGEGKLHVRLSAEF